jgi:hypothetical protein
MEPNQNPPSEREWTMAEREDFFAHWGTSCTAMNGIPNAPTAPLTLDMLVKMKEDFDKQFPEPIKYKDGADMSPETFKALGIPIVKTRECGISGHSSTLYGIDVHIVPGMPFGVVEECRCKERYKLKFQALNPLPPQDLPSMIEFTQEMPIEEARKRWPNTPVPGEEKK